MAIGSQGKPTFICKWGPCHQWQHTASIWQIAMDQLEIPIGSVNIRLTDGCWWIPASIQQSWGGGGVRMDGWMGEGGFTSTFVPEASGVLHDDGVSVKKCGGSAEWKQCQRVPHPQPEFTDVKIHGHRLDGLLHRAFIQCTYLPFQSEFITNKFNFNTEV